MMTDNISETTATPVSQNDAADLDNSPGSQIQRAREQAGLSRDELSQRLCMPGNKLEMLERDEYDRLPSALYVRGYIRNICKELKIEAEPVLQAFSGYAAAEQESQAILAHVSRGPVVEEKRRRSYKAFALLPLVAVAVVFWWMNGRHLAPPSFSIDSAASEAPAAAASTGDTGIAGSESPTGVATAAEVPVEEAAADSAETAEQLTEATPKPAAVGAPAGKTEDAAATEESVAARADTPATAVPQPAATADSAAVAAGESGAEAEEASAPAAAVPTESVQLGFSEEAWIEVRDATGALLMAKLQPAGADVTLEGQPPFKLMLGNAAATQVHFRGELVNSDPIGSRRTRRLTVGQ